jgi:hypothetical protein
MVYSYWHAAGFRQRIIRVLEFPPKEDLRILVKDEFTIENVTFIFSLQINDLR